MATRTAPSRPRRRSAETQPLITNPETATDAISTFAAKLLVGQRCEQGCGNPAAWVALTRRRQRWACNLHVSELLDQRTIWLLYPLELAHAAPAAA